MPDLIVYILAILATGAAGVNLGWRLGKASAYRQHVEALRTLARLRRDE